MNTQLIRFVLVFALMFSAGCVINGRQQAQYVPPSAEEQAANMPEEAVAQPAQNGEFQSVHPSNIGRRGPPQDGNVRPQPPVVQKRMVGPRFNMYPAQLQAPDNMSVKVVNTSPYFACLISPTFGTGQPVFRMRFGGFEQDFLANPGWAQVGCAAVLMPNRTQNSEMGPEAWLSVNRVGTYNLVVKFYTYDGNDPQDTGIVIQQSLSFPNTWRINPHCPQWYHMGCLHNFALRAALEAPKDDSVLAALDVPVLFI